MNDKATVPYLSHTAFPYMEKKALNLKLQWKDIFIKQQKNRKKLLIIAAVGTTFTYVKWKIIPTPTPEQKDTNLSRKSQICGVERLLKAQQYKAKVKGVSRWRDSISDYVPQ